ncbi:MAG: proton-conducting transporter membrane subunit [Bacteroidales bacterium]|nr:proton-conducting transporter membrane subunit [Bacteroidales bacterium]MDD3010095.1 proton-conducting transporter membrane subunit [Bacteroidales bacterium]MDD3960641.1 proton-conducting transporter membrane subunit [Bacteroidales bacterium]HPE85954.1 proton-conducting transporter membrane subunit [Bacteroidales bacterium]
MTGIFLIGTILIGVLLYLNKNTIVHYSVVGVYVLLLVVFGGYEYLHINETENLFFKPDALSVLLLFALCVVSLPAIYHTYKYMVIHNETPRPRGLFFAAMIFLISAICMAYVANNIAVMWIFVEITTLSASVLIYHHRNIRALEGVWKYVFICAISITFIYIGILFLSLAMKEAGIETFSFDALMAHAAQLDPFWLKLAFLFIFTGFTAKIGLVPMYTAGIDAKDKAPAPAGALLSSILMNMGFVGIYRVYAIISKTEIQSWAATVMIVSAILSIFVATVYMINIKNIKRMFAYSSIEHMGIVVLGLAVGGIGTYAAILHIILHTFVKPALFFQFNQVYRVYQSKNIYDTGHYFKYNKAGALVLLLGFFSATAMPPSGLFISEFLIFQSLFEARMFILLVVVLLLLTMIIWGFGSNIFKLLFTPPAAINEKQIPRISPWDSVTQYALLALAVFFAYHPPATFVQLIHEAVKLIH